MGGVRNGSTMLNNTSPLSAFIGLKSSLYSFKLDTDWTTLNIAEKWRQYVALNINGGIELPYT